MSNLACPKCEGRLRKYERSGIVIERCDACRGLFLDQGELEHLIEAEGALLYRSRPPRRRPKPDRMGKEHIPITERILGGR